MYEAVREGETSKLDLAGLKVNVVRLQSQVATCRRPAGPQAGDHRILQSAAPGWRADAQPTCSHTPWRPSQASCWASAAGIPTPPAFELLGGPQAAYQVFGVLLGHVKGAIVAATVCPVYGAAARRVRLLLC